MNGLVFHIVSGQAFFTGVLLLVLAAVASLAPRPVIARLSVIAFLVGVIAIVVSSTAIPSWLSTVAAASSLVWIASAYKQAWRRRASCVTALVWSVAALVEAPYHVTPTLDLVADRSIAVIGDSVTAGMGGDGVQECWPEILARERNLRVQDISHMGETAASALKRAKGRQIDAPLVFVEIGGNDVLGSTTTTQFASDLDSLLSHLSAADRQVVMFELPLPPFCHEYGRAQRSAAAKHGVVLIPKRVFLSVLAADGATLDSIHLSDRGHRMMAECVWRVIGGAYGDP